MKRERAIEELIYDCLSLLDNIRFILDNIRFYQICTEVENIFRKKKS